MARQSGKSALNMRNRPFREKQSGFSALNSGKADLWKNKADNPS